MNKYDNYFLSRNVSLNSSEYEIPWFLGDIINKIDKNDAILDIGCGPCFILLELKKRDYSNLHGIDLDAAAVEAGKRKGLDIVQSDIQEYVSKQKYKIIFMNHVLEHVEKDKVIEVLRYIRESLLDEGGALYLTVPNAQSNTGCYWAYEDFTHNTLFTTGSLSYVVRMAGFEKFDFLDINNLGPNKNGKKIKRLIKKTLLSIYKSKIKFWNIVTGSAFHKSSPIAFGFEIRILAQK